MKTFEEQFDSFLRKWCSNYYPHLCDTDENDGQALRDFVEENYIEKQKVRETINVVTKKWTDSDEEVRVLREVRDKLLEGLGLEEKNV